MSNRLKPKKGRSSIAETYLGPKPGDYPLGSLKSRAAARAMLDAYAEKLREEEEARLANLTPVERAEIQALIEDVDERPVRIWMIRLFQVAQEEAKVYEKALPSTTPEEIRHRRAVFKEINRMTDGGASSLFMQDSLKWNRWKAIAEENLRAKEKKK